MDDTEYEMELSLELDVEAGTMQEIPFPFPPTTGGDKGDRQ